jgi:hypothetical protein
VLVHAIYNAGFGLIAWLMVRWKKHTAKTLPNIETYQLIPQPLA